MTIAHRQRFFVYLVAAGAVTCMLGLADRLQGSPPGEALSDDGDHSSFGASAEVEVTPSRLPNLVPGVGGAAQNESATRAVDRLQPFRQNGLRSVLVHVRPGTDRARLRAFVRRCGAEVHHEYKILPNVLNLRDLSDLDVEELKKLSDVVRVEDDMMAHAHLTRSTSLMRAMQSQITGAGLSADGSGVRVCIIDTGINPNHIMYSSRIDTAAGRDFVNNDNDPTDDNGHGSNVAGIAVGGTGVTATRCGVSEPLQGVAPNATLIGVKVLSATGSGSFADVIAGIDYCADQTPSGGRADVINLSLGGGAFSGNCDSDPAAQAANNAVANGVVVVVSAGNEGNTNRMGTPACASGTIAVGAVYDDDLPNCEFPSPTNYGWCLDSFCFNTCTDNSPR
ncbi:MAG: S8 family serine peptidase, partial [Phycisphaerae bacterium]